MFRRAKRQNGNNARGFSLLEVLIASIVFLVGATAILGTITVAAMMNAGHGVQGTRATEYAVAKMEDLMATPFKNISAGTGTDYIIQGTTDTISSTSTGAAYSRQWTIAVSGNVATVTVVVTSLQVAKWGNVTSPIIPSTTLVSQKTNYNSDTN